MSSIVSIVFKLFFLQKYAKDILVLSPAGPLLDENLNTISDYPYQKASVSGHPGAVFIRVCSSQKVRTFFNAIYKGDAEFKFELKVL